MLDAPPLDQLICIEVWRAHPFEQSLLVGDDTPGGRGQLGRDLPRDQQDAVLVGVDQVAGADQQPTDNHRPAGSLHPHVGMRHARPAGEELEAHGVRLFQVADAAVGDAAGAAQGSEYGGVHLAPERATTRLFVHVLHHHHARLGNFAYMPIESSLVAVRLTSARADGRGRRISHQRPELREDPPDVHLHVALVPRPDREGLDGIAQGGRVEGLERLQHGWIKLGGRHRLSRAPSLTPLTTLTGSSPSSTRVRLSRTISSARASASNVKPATWGEKKTFSIRRSGLSAGVGSCSKTSSPAPPRWPDSRAAMSAFSSTTGPRDALTRNAPFRMRLSAAALMSGCVVLSSGTCTQTTSASCSRSTNGTRSTPEKVLSTISA